MSFLRTFDRSLLFRITKYNFASKETTYVLHSFCSIRLIYVVVNEFRRSTNSTIMDSRESNSNKYDNLTLKMIHEITAFEKSTTSSPTVTEDCDQKCINFQPPSKLIKLSDDVLQSTHDTGSASSTDRLLDDISKKSIKLTGDENDQKQMQNDHPKQGPINANDTLHVLPFAEVDTSDSDVIIQDTVTEKPQKKKIKSRKKNASKEGRGQAKPRPTHFVAIQIKHPEIHNKIHMVQKHIIFQNADLKTAMIQLPTLHLTIAVMHLDAKDEVNIERAKKAMDDVAMKLKDFSLIPLTIEFKGLEHFSNEVLYVKVSDINAVNKMKHIASVIKDVFDNINISVDDKEFKAHLTILKLSKLKWKKKQALRKIEPRLYEEAKNMDFGKEDVTNIQLLSMLDKKDKDGYFHCLKNISFEQCVE